MRVLAGLALGSFALAVLWGFLKTPPEFFVIVDKPVYSPAIFDPSDIDAATLFLESHPDTRIAITSKDYNLAPETGRLLFEQGQREGVEFFITTQPSQSLLASLDLFKDGKSLLLNTSATTTAASETDDFILRIIPDLRQEQAFISDYIVTTGAKRILVLIDGSNEAYTANAFRHFKERTQGKGGVRIQSQEVSFRDLKIEEFQALFNQPVDLLYILAGDFQSGVGNVAQYFHQQHPQARIVLTPWARSSAIFDTAGPATSQIVLISHFASRSEDPKLDEYLKKFRARFGYEPHYMAIKVRQALELLHQAIESGHDTPIAVKRYLLSQARHQTSLGEIQFDASGDRIGGFHIVTGFD